MEAPNIRSDHQQYLILASDWTRISDDGNNVVTTFNKGLLWSSVVGSDEPVVTSVKHGVSIPWNSCPKLKFTEISRIEYDLLVAVKRDSDRFIIFEDKFWLQEGKDLDVNDRVRFQHVDHLPQDATGYIRYKGHSDPGQQSGILFGIELSPEYAGRGTSDGTFKRMRYFECDENCAVFYSLKFIRKKPVPEIEGEPDVFTSARTSPESNLQDIRNEGRASPVDTAPAVSPISVGEDVVWLSDTGPELGTVRWVGQIPDLDPVQRWYAGVEFAKPIGKGTGRYRGLQLFQAQRDHASLVPVVGLIRHSDYFRQSSGSATSSLPVQPQQDPNMRPYRDLHHGPEFSGYLSTFTGNSTTTSLSSNIHNKSDKDMTSPKEMLHFDNKDNTFQDDGMDGNKKYDGAEPLNSSSTNSSRDFNFSTSGGPVGDNPSSIRGTGSSYGPPGDLAVNRETRTYENIRNDTGENSRSSAEENLVRVRCGADTFSLGDRVEVQLVPPRFGVIRWLGRRHNADAASDPGPVIAGLMMESVDERCYTDGTFEGRTIFKSEPHRSFFIFLNKCRHAPLDN